MTSQCRLAIPARHGPARDITHQQVATPGLLQDVPIFLADVTRGSTETFMSHPHDPKNYP